MAGQAEFSGAPGEGKFTQSFELSEIESEQAGAAEMAQHAALHGQGLGNESRERQSGLGIGGENVGGEGIKEVILGGGNFGGLREGLAKAWIVVALEGGQQFGADSVTQELGAEVGGVLTERLADGLKVLLNLTAGDGKERTNEAGRKERFVFGDRRVGELGESEVAMNSGEAGGAGSAQQTEEDGFGLIVTSVGGGDALKTVGERGALEERVAGASAGGFNGKMEEGRKRGDILGFDGAVERKLGCQIEDKTLIRLGGSAAQVVVEMKDEGDDAESGCEFGEGTEEGDGIGASADGHTDALAGRDEVMLAQVGFKRAEHGSMISRSENVRSRVPICHLGSKRDGDWAEGVNERLEDQGKTGRMEVEEYSDEPGACRIRK